MSGPPRWLARGRGARGIILSDLRTPRHYGKHELWLEGDLLASMQHGEFTLADMRIYTDIAAEVMAQYGYCLMLFDSKDAGSLDADARRYIAHWSVGKPILGIATYNAGLTSRALFTLVLKAMNLIGRQPLPFSFFKAEQEARAWLAQLRQQHLSKAQPGTPPRAPG